MAPASNIHHWTTYELRDITTCARSATSLHIRYQATKIEIKSSQSKSSPQDRSQVKPSQVRKIKLIQKHWNPDDRQQRPRPSIRGLELIQKHLNPVDRQQRSRLSIRSLELIQKHLNPVDRQQRSRPSIRSLELIQKHLNPDDRHRQRPSPSMRSLESSSTTLHPIIYTVYVLGAGAHSCGSPTTRGCHALRILSFHICKDVWIDITTSLVYRRSPASAHQPSLIRPLYSVYTNVYVYHLNSGFSHCVELVPILSTNLDDRKHCASSYETLCSVYSATEITWNSTAITRSNKHGYLINLHPL